MKEILLNVIGGILPVMGGILPVIGGLLHVIGALFRHMRPQISTVNLHSCLASYQRYPACRAELTSI